MMVRPVTVDGGDAPSRALRAIRHETRIREGEDQGSVFGGFEKYTKVTIVV